MDLKQQIIDLSKKLDSTDSKAEEKAIKAELKSLDRKFFDGTYVKYNDKLGRIWHSHFATYAFRGNDISAYNWSGNTDYVTLDKVEFLTEPMFDETSLEEIEYKIDEAESKLRKLKEDRHKIQATCFHKVDPSSFEESDDVNRAAFSGDGTPCYYRYAVCEICGKSIRS